MAGCMGYRTPMLDPNSATTGNPLPPTSPADDAGPGAVAKDASVVSTKDVAAKDAALPDATGDAPTRDDAASPDAAPKDAPSPDATGDAPTRKDAASPDAAPKDAPSPDAAARDAASDGPTRDGATDPTRDSAGRDARTDASCTPGEAYVLVLGGDDYLYRFDPSKLALALTSPAPVSCATTRVDGDDSLNSMTVSPIGPAYISNHSGNICLVDLTTMRAQSTGFDPASISYSSFGMALLPDNSPSRQTLYVSVQSLLSTGPDTLERIDLGTYAPTPIGAVKPVGDYEQDLPSAELTAGPNGELYGFAVGPESSKLLTIDPSTATALDVINVDKGFTEASFALVSWQGAFYLFVGNADSKSPNYGGCEVYRYVKGDSQVTDLGPLGVAIIGAGVASCQ